MNPIANALFTGPWTAVVTATGVALAKVTGDFGYITSYERMWAKGLLRTWGVSLRVTGDVDADAPYIVIANHQSHADVPILFATLPMIPGFVAKKELLKVPFLGMALREGGHVLIDRSDRKSAMAAMQEAAEDIRVESKTIAVFPEGTRGDGRHLQQFKKGGFVLAQAARVPIVPVGIRGSYGILPRGARWPHAAKVEVRVGRTIEADEVESLSLAALMARTRAVIAELSGLEPE